MDRQTRTAPSSQDTSGHLWAHAVCVRWLSCARRACVWGNLGTGAWHCPSSATKSASPFVCTWPVTGAAGAAAGRWTEAESEFQTDPALGSVENYSWLLSNAGLNCAGPLTQGLVFSPISTVGLSYHRFHIGAFNQLGIQNSSFAFPTANGKYQPQMEKTVSYRRLVESAHVTGGLQPQKLGPDFQLCSGRSPPFEGPYCSRVNCTLDWFHSLSGTCAAVTMATLTWSSSWKKPACSLISGKLPWKEVSF